MSKQDFKIKKGLNVNDGVFIANDDEVSIDGVVVLDYVDAADVVLQGNIDTVQSNVDTVQDNIDTEATTRGSADTTLQGNIDTVVVDLSTAISNGIDTLTTAEVTQLGNINTTTIDTTQWGVVGSLDQSLTTTSTVTFNTISGNGSGLTSLPNIFDQSLNTTDSPTFVKTTQANMELTGTGSISTTGNGLLRLSPGGTGTVEVSTDLSLNEGKSLFLSNDCALQPYVVDGAAAVAYIFKTNTALVSPIARLMEVTNGSSILFQIGIDGSARADNLTAVTTNADLVLTGNGTGKVHVNEDLNVTGTLDVTNSVVCGAGNNMVLVPGQGPTFVAYKFDTVQTITSGKIASFLNNTSEIMAVTASGIDVTGQITGSEPWSLHTTTVANEGITGVINNKYMVDTTASTANIVLTMPTTTQVGTTITITDMKNNFVGAGTKNVITNTILFEGVSQTFEFDVANSTAQLIYTGASYGWKAIVIQ